MLLTIIVLLGIALFVLGESLLSYADLIEMIEMKEDAELKALLASVVFFLGAVVASIVVLLPFLRDYRSIRKHEYRVIEAIFVRYDFRKTGGENSDMRAIPLFCDTLTREILTFDWEEELIQDECYRIGYLPNTKTAVIEKL